MLESLTDCLFLTDRLSTCCNLQIIVIYATTLKSSTFSLRHLTTTSVVNLYIELWALISLLLITAFMKDWEFLTSEWAPKNSGGELLRKIRGNSERRTFWFSKAEKTKSWCQVFFCVIDWWYFEVKNYSEKFLGRNTGVISKWKWYVEAENYQKLFLTYKTFFK